MATGWLTLRSKRALGAQGEAPLQPLKPQMHRFACHLCPTSQGVEIGLADLVKAEMSTLPLRLLHLRLHRLHHGAAGAGGWNEEQAWARPAATGPATGILAWLPRAPPEQGERDVDHYRQPHSTSHHTTYQSQSTPTTITHTAPALNGRLRPAAGLPTNQPDVCRNGRHWPGGPERGEQGATQHAHPHAPPTILLLWRHFHSAAWLTAIMA